MPTYRRSPAATWRRLRAGMVVAVPGDADPLQLNDAAALVWDVLEEPHDAGQLAARLAAAFDQPDTDVALAVTQLLEDLVSAGAVEKS